MNKTLYNDIKNKDIMKLNINIFKRQRKPEGYVEKYLRPQKPEGYERKAVYISRENHETVRRIIGMLGSRKTTISGYIDRILTEHLDKYGDELEKAREKKYREIVGRKPESL